MKYIWYSPQKSKYPLYTSLLFRSKVVNAPNQDPVVQNFVSLTLLLSPQFVNYVPTSKANALLFSVDFYVRILCNVKDSHIFSTKNNSVFVIFMLTLKF